MDAYKKYYIGPGKPHKINVHEGTILLDSASVQQNLLCSFKMIFN